MRSTAFARLAAQVYDAALAPEMWPSALSAISMEIGVVGAAYVVRDHATDEVAWLSYAGPCAEGKADYVTHYAKVSAFVPLLAAAPKGEWLQLTKCLPDATLRRDEWYQDFYVKRGVDDIIGARIAESATHNARLGLHHGVRQARVAFRERRFRAVLQLVAGAAQLQLELARLRWRSAASLRALDELPAGVVLATSEGRVVGMNRAAERFARQGDGVVIRRDQIGALRSFEETKLAKLIAAAATDRDAPLAARMLIGRKGVIAPLVVTVAPLSVSNGFAARPLALVFINDLGDLPPSWDDVASLFGLSPAESRLAVGLAMGKKPRDIALASNVQITTLRTQLSSIMKKVGATRQTDLVRILARIDRVKSAQG